jgi:hypothetical protein
MKKSIVLIIFMIAVGNTFAQNGEVMLTVPADVRGTIQVGSKTKSIFAEAGDFVIFPVGKKFKLKINDEEFGVVGEISFDIKNQKIQIAYETNESELFHYFQGDFLGSKKEFKTFKGRVDNTGIKTSLIDLLIEESEREN